MLLVFVAVAAYRVPADLAITAASRQSALIVKDTQFDRSVQLQTDLDLGVRAIRAVNADTEVSLEAGAGLGAVGPSAIASGYRYRGLATRGVYVSAGWIPQEGIGGFLAVRAVLASYTSTSLLFFYPEVEFSPALSTPIGQRVRLDWTLPISYQFRTDLQYAFSFGLRTTFRLEIAPW